MLKRVFPSVLGAVMAPVFLVAFSILAPISLPLAAQESSAQERSAGELSMGPGGSEAGQQAPAAVGVLDPALLAAYRWRNIGPDRGGRSIASAGVVGRPQEAYFGATGGGLWKTTDGGENWGPVTDFKITSASVGAVDVSETNPDLVFIGMGESCIRGNIMPGDGVYRSPDAGETWEHVGFRGSDAIAKILRSPNQSRCRLRCIVREVRRAERGAGPFQEHRRR